MKIFILFYIFFLLTTVQLQANNTRKVLKPNQGARTTEELARAVFSALKDNNFQNLQQYFPEEKELRVLRRRSSEDMQLVLEKTSTDSLKQQLQRDFNLIVQQATGKGFNWTDWEMASAQATRRDRRNPLLYSVQLDLAKADGQHETVWFEAVKVRGRYFLFRQLVFKPAPQAAAGN